MASVVALMSSEALNEMVGKAKKRGIWGSLRFEPNKLQMVDEGVDGGLGKGGGAGMAIDFQRVTQTGKLISSVSFLEASENFSHVRIGVHTLIISCVLAVENEFPRDG